MGTAAPTDHRGLTPFWADHLARAQREPVDWGLSPDGDFLATILFRAFRARDWLPTRLSNVTASRLLGVQMAQADMAMSEVIRAGYVRRVRDDDGVGRLEWIGPRR